jgi:hypothetical protein
MWGSGDEFAIGCFHNTDGTFRYDGTRFAVFIANIKFSDKDIIVTSSKSSLTDRDRLDSIFNSHRIL